MRHEFAVELRSAMARPKPPPKPRVPRIRRTLILAYQIAAYAKDNDISSLTTFCRCANITTARASQIMALLNLSAVIQAEILLSDWRLILNVAESNVRHISREIFWADQETMWRKQVDFLASSWRSTKT